MDIQLTKKDIVVVIPVYKATPSAHEQICITQTLRVLAYYAICYVAPSGLDTSAYPQASNVSVSFFNPMYFEGIAGYNRLMLSSAFYQQFASYTYMLICQPDVFVFADSLLAHAQKGYDYWGAPWIKKPFRNVVFYVFVKEGLRKTLQLLLHNNVSHAVGNGGLSLRKTASYINFIQKHPRKVEQWSCNEDFFWSFFTYKEKFKKPSFDEAIAFCIETEPEYCLHRLHNQLPFGIHGWPKVNAHFWEKHIKAFGYEF